MYTLHSVLAIPDISQVAIIISAPTSSSDVSWAKTLFPQGFHKRFEVALIGPEWLPDSEDGLLSCKQSDSLLRKVHTYLSQHTLPDDRSTVIYMDEFALSIYDAVSAGLREFLSSLIAIFH